jgi:hypothetical protein
MTNSFFDTVSVATGCTDSTVKKRWSAKVEWAHPVATAPGSV